MLSAADSSTNNTDKEVASKATPLPSVLASHASGSFKGEQVMLSTAVILVCDDDGSRRACRALLDCGSQANFISKKFVEILGLETRPLNVSISGVNGTVISSNHMVRIKLQSRLNSYTTIIECIVTDQVTDKIPGRDEFNFPRNIRLTDPRFHISSDIDLLIGAELFWNLICVGQVKSSDKHPMLQKRRLDFGGSFGQHPIDRLKGSLVSRVQCGITQTCQSCLANGHLCVIGQLHNGGKYLQASLFRQRVSKFSG